MRRTYILGCGPAQVFCESSSSVRRPLRLHRSLCSVGYDFRNAPGCGTALVSSLGPQRLGAPQAFADPSASVAHPSPPFLIDVRGGAARAPGAGVGGQRSHGWRSAADFRVSGRPGGPQRTSGDGAWAVPDLERLRLPGRPRLRDGKSFVACAPQAFADPSASITLPDRWMEPVFGPVLLDALLPPAAGGPFAHAAAWVQVEVASIHPRPRSRTHRGSSNPAGIRPFTISRNHWRP